MTLSLSLDQPAWTVSQLARASRRLIEEGLGALWVRGEVTGLKVYQSGHWYFGLRDRETQIRCTMWRTHALKAGAPPTEGAQVYAFGAPTVWEEKGEFRFNVLELLATDRMGLQFRNLERVKAALAKDGLFDAERKRPLPSLPSRVAVVTSLEGAALRDIITVTRKRWSSVELVVVGATVQGADAESAIVRALRIVNRLAGIDLCIIGRGGGGPEDLAAFNSEAVCRALAAVRVPTVSAVGHETDVSLTDLIADARAATPSAAVELAVPDRDEVLRRAASLANRLASGLRKRTQLASERLGRTGDRLQGALDQILDSHHRQVERLAAQLDALSPLSVLDRGYCVAQGPEGRVLKRRADFADGAGFTLRITDGRVSARVEPSP